MYKLKSLPYVAIPFNFTHREAAANFVYSTFIVNNEALNAPLEIPVDMVLGDFFKLEVTADSIYTGTKPCYQVTMDLVNCTFYNRRERSIKYMTTGNSSANLSLFEAAILAAREQGYALMEMSTSHFYSSIRKESGTFTSPIIHLPILLKVGDDIGILRFDCLTTAVTFHKPFRSESNLDKYYSEGNSVDSVVSNISRKFIQPLALDQGAIDDISTEMERYFTRI